MTRLRFIKQPLKMSDINLDDLDDEFYEEISRDWEKRARRLQSRRWEKIEES